MFTLWHNVSNRIFSGVSSTKDPPSISSTTEFSGLPKSALGKGKITNSFETFHLKKIVGDPATTWLQSIVAVCLVMLHQTWHFIVFVLILVK